MATENVTSHKLIQAIPQPPRIPVVGYALSLDRQSPLQNLVRLAAEYGPIFQIDIMGVPMVIVSGLDMVTELCDETRFDKAVRGALARARKLAGDGLFTAKTKEPNWGKAHNILLAPFGGRAMQSYHEAMVDIANQLCLKWERLNGDDEIDVVHDMTALTLDTIGLCGFDYRFNSFYRQDYHPFVAAMVRSLETIMMMRGLPFEGLVMRERIASMEQDTAFMNALVDDLVRERRTKLQAQEQKDLLNAMLNGVDKTSGEPLDDVNIRYQIITFLIAGHETTSGLLSYAIAALLKHPDVLAKAYEEVDRVLGADLTVKPTYQQVSQLVYISQILKESLRLWPPAPAFGLRGYNDEVIGAGYPIPKMAMALVLIPVLHRDPEIWGPDAETFNPDHFTRAAEAQRPTHAWKPFGNGQRACIGRGFAMHEAALALGMILQRFKLIDHLNYQLKTKETLTVKPDGLKIKIALRTAADRAANAGDALQFASANQNQAIVTAPAPNARPTHNTPLLILYGSNLGVAEELAHRLGEAADLNGFETEVAPLDSFVGALPKTGGLVVVSASYNGAPPDNAANFMRWLNSDHPADTFSGLHYAVFGCGDRDWAATYQAIPRAIDERLEALGATRFIARGEGDAREDIDNGYDAWLNILGPAVVKQFNLDTQFNGAVAPLYSLETINTGADSPAADAIGARAATIVENRELQNPVDGALRSTRHIALRLPEGATYCAGDHLAVAPQNDAALIAAIAARFGLTPDTIIRLQAPSGRRAHLPVGENLSVGRLLRDYAELQTITTRKQVRLMADYTRCPRSTPMLAALSADTEAGEALYRAEILVKKMSAFDVLAQYPACELPFSLYLEMLPPMQPRYYSIASSPLVDPMHCAITVAVVAGEARPGRGVYKGVCSNYLAERKADEIVLASVRASSAFRLPDDPTTPLLMIGPGTGLAPFIGFLQQRAVQVEQGKQLGPAMLFFGCRRRDQDFLYQAELENWAKKGLVDLHVAFSRPVEGTRAYVQDLLRAQADTVWAILAAGAKIYICGDGARMEPDVRAALIALYCEKSGVDAAGGAQWLAGLIAKNRYCLDVWANN